MKLNGHYYSLVNSQENKALIDEEKTTADSNKEEKYEVSKFGNFD